MGIFSFLKRKIPHKVIFCGLDNSGKSTIISFLETGRFVEHTPTMGKSKEEIEVKGTRLSLIDMGGQDHFRQLWLGELQKDTKCVVFVIDRTDQKRFGEAKNELKKLLPMIKEKNVKLLIFANKSDLPSAAPIGMIFNEFQLDQVENFEILEISARTGFGIADAFVKLYTVLTGQLIKKNSFAQAVSIYDVGGIPIVTKSKTTDDLSEETLRGGFLSAITAFAKETIGGSSVKIETPSGDSFIVKKSQHLIGALLWKKNLNMPIQESEEALIELLNHLEGCMQRMAPDPYNENVQYLFNQYATNIL